MPRTDDSMGRAWKRPSRGMALLGAFGLWRCKDGRWFFTLGGILRHVANEHAYPWIPGQCWRR